MGGAEINTDSIAMLIVTYALVAIALIDLDHQIIPNKITLPLLVAGLAFRGIQGELIPAVLGLLAGAGPLGLIAVVYSKGMGWGDVKLLGMLGVFVGWQKIIITMFLGSFLGVVWMVPLILTGKFDRKTPFAFGPFLAAGALLVLYGWDLLTQVFGMLMGF
jgi:leader peptidase (prepilin peptidase)/N-methyltransferase